MVKGWFTGCFHSYVVGTILQPVFAAPFGWILLHFGWSFDGYLELVFRTVFY